MCTSLCVVICSYADLQIVNQCHFVKGMNKKLTADLPVGRQGTAKKFDFSCSAAQFDMVRQWFDKKLTNQLTNRAHCIALRLDLLVSIFLN